MSTRVEFRRAKVLTNPARFDAPISIQVVLDVFEKPPAEPLDVKFTWAPIWDTVVDQELDELAVGPLAHTGTHELTLESDPPDVTQIPDPTGPTALLLSFCYRGEEFLHLGFNVIVDLEGDLPERFTSCERLTRRISGCVPKQTPIRWDQPPPTPLSCRRLDAGRQDPEEPAAPPSEGERPMKKARLDTGLRSCIDVIFISVVGVHGVNQLFICFATMQPRTSNRTVEMPRDDAAFRILLLGEGNMSFAHGLVKKLSKSRIFQRHHPEKTATRVEGAVHRKELPLRQRHLHLLVTTFDDGSALSEKYPETGPILDYFMSKSRMEIDVVNSVNAACIPQTLGGSHRPHHLIVFNNPHIGFEDFVRQRSLLSHFLRSAASVAGWRDSLPTQVVVALCDEQPRRWDLLGAARRAGLVAVAAVPLTASEYPLYSPKRHQSDTAFPFKHMIQYVLMRYEDCRDVVLQLKTLFAAHGLCGAGQALEDWDRMVQELEAERDVTGTIRSHSGDAVSAPAALLWASEDLHAYASAILPGCPEDQTFCVPLLHPSFAFYAGGPRPGATDAFSPYIAAQDLPGLYALQLDLVAQEQGREEHSPDSAAVRPPPHLDAAVLGRPLTAKETAKLQRFFAHNSRDRRQGHTRPQKPVQEYRCQRCSRTFETAHDLTQHHRSKHSEQPLLHPNMYAAGHRDIIQDTDVDLPADGAPTGVPCDICGLVFRNSTAYDTHLHLLAPSPQTVGGNAASITSAESRRCVVCCPPRINTSSFSTPSRAANARPSRAGNQCRASSAIMAHQRFILGDRKSDMTCSSAGRLVCDLIRRGSLQTASLFLFLPMDSSSLKNSPTGVVEPLAVGQFVRAEYAKGKYEIGKVESIDEDGGTVTISTSNGFDVTLQRITVKRAFLLILDLNGVLVARGRGVCTHRPYVKEFIRFAFENFAVGVWTSGLQRSGDPIIESVMGEYKNRLLFRLYRQDCIDVSTKGNEYGTLKDLQKIFTKFPESFHSVNTILIDDSPGKCSHPDIALCPVPFKDAATQKNDDGLQKVMEVLQQVLEHNSHFPLIQAAEERRARLQQEEREAASAAVAQPGPPEPGSVIQEVSLWSYRLCCDYLMGRCNRKDCGYRHEADDGVSPCSRKGACSKGHAQRWKGTA
eukprot:gene7545-5324_t